MLTIPPNGYVRLHRRIMAHWIARDPLAFALFVALIAAAHRERSRTMLRRQLVHVERGQLATSWNDLATRFGVDRKTIRAKLDMLVADGMLDIKSDQCGTIITVLNYDKYQAAEDDERTSDGTTDRTTERTTDWTAERTHLEKERKRERETGFTHAAQRRAKKGKGFPSPSARAQRAVALATALALEQNERGNGWPTYEARDRLAELWPLFQTAFPRWDRFAGDYVRQVAKGYGIPFAKEAVASLRSIAQADGTGPPVDEPPTARDFGRATGDDDQRLETQAELESMESHRNRGGDDA